MYGLYTALVTTALVVGYGPAAVVRRVTRGVPVNLRSRLGWARALDSSAPRGWIHAVSVGEAIAAAPLLSGLARLYPDLPLVMTTTTETGARVVRDRYADLVTHRYAPVDLPGAVRRVTDAIEPAFLIVMETELWPNLMRHLRARAVPVMIANGRISDRSFPRYRRARRFMTPVLACVSVFGMQSDEDARRAIALGAPPERVFVTGNLKNDAAADLAGTVELWQRLLGLTPGQRVWIAGSTHAGEEAIVVATHRTLAAARPDLTLVLAPRHPERVADVAAIVAAHGFRPVRRSELPRAGVAGAVIILDTVGELAQLYAVGDVVFVGGSLVPSGGHNMLEAGLRRKPVLFGPHTENFRDAAAALLASGGGIRVGDADALVRETGRLLDDDDLRKRLGEAAFDAVASRSGAVKETLDLVARFLKPGAAT